MLTQMLGASELLQHVAHLIEDEHAHHLALDHDDTALVVHGHASRMLQNVRAELANELAVLVVDLNLMRRTAFGYDEVTCVAEKSAFC